MYLLAHRVTVIILLGLSLVPSWAVFEYDSGPMGDFFYAVSISGWAYVFPWPESGPHALGLLAILALCIWLFRSRVIREHMHIGDLLMMIAPLIALPHWLVLLSGFLRFNNPPDYGYGLRFVSMELTSVYWLFPMALVAVVLLMFLSFWRLRPLLGVEY